MSPIFPLVSLIPFLLIYYLFNFFIILFYLFQVLVYLIPFSLQNEGSVNDPINIFFFAIKEFFRFLLLSWVILSSMKFFHM